jgi:hypothetical protein
MAAAVLGFWNSRPSICSSGRRAFRCGRRCRLRRWRIPSERPRRQGCYRRRGPAARGAMGGYAPSTDSDRSKALRKLIFAGNARSTARPKSIVISQRNQELRAGKSAAFKVI